MRVRLLLVLSTLAAAGFPGTVAAQEADVRAAVLRTFAAANAGDIEGLLREYAMGARVLLEGERVTELAADQLAARLGDVAWTPRAMRTQVLGRSAVTVAEVDGALRLEGLVDVEGPWRYAETRVLDAGSWRIVQQELSPLGDATAGPRGTTATRAVTPAPASATSANLPSATASATASATDSAAEGQGALAVDAGARAPAQDGSGGAGAAQPRASFVLDTQIFGPPPPVPPAVISRDGQGNATVRAIRLDAPLDVDGRLDEPVYAQVPPLDDFIQSLPDEGQPATELTEAWVMFDDDNVYVSARIHEEVPESEWVANEMRRDANQIGNNDNFGLVFDTYYDRRNGYFFYTNPLGAMVDVQVTNEGSPNFDWNPVWDVRTGRFDGGWTVEVMIPFKSLRYQPGTAQVWGVQLRRAIRRKNEWSHLTLVSRQAAGASGRNGIIRMSRAATLVGLEAPPTGLNVDVKPYGIAGLTTDHLSSPTVDNHVDGDGGVDLKWGITQNLAADFTYNTDFAQVEVDEQQVNLTRYSLVFPEKREFFLESRGIFNFPANTAGGGGGGSAPTLFFSRRVGLQGGRPVPILGGGRLTGKLGPFDIGALNIETDDLDDVGARLTNFTAVRVRADVLSRSNLGAIFTRRSRSLAADGWNHTYGADAAFSFLDDVYLTGYYAMTQTPELAVASERLAQSYQGRLSYDGDLQGFSVSHLLVEDDFNPEVGLVRRSGFRQTQATIRASPRPSISWIRQATLQGSADYLENAREGFVETRELSASLGIELENSDQLNLAYTDSYENLVTEERITGATIPAGRYAFDAVDGSFSFGPQRFFSGSVSFRYGNFYDGTLTSAGVNRGRVEILRQLSLEPSVSFNWVRLPGQHFNTTLAATRVNYTFSPRMFFSTLVQYNSASDAFSVNARLRWEYAPGSELFLVYTEERDTYDWQRFPVLSNRGLVIKATRLLRF